MKKTVSFTLAAFTLLFALSFTRLIKAEAAGTFSLSNPSASALPRANMEKPQEPSFTDSVIAILLNTHIDKAIQDYFGRPTQTALYDAKIDSITRSGLDFAFRVTVTVPTFHGPHNPPYGLETMTFTVKPGGVILDSYHHKDVAP